MRIALTPKATWLALSTILAGSASLQPGEFCDDFEDGNLGDCDCWEVMFVDDPPVGEVNESGEVVMRNSRGGSYGGLLLRELVDGDVSVRTQARMVDPSGGGEIDLFAHFSRADGSGVYAVEFYPRGEIILRRFDRRSEQWIHNRLASVTIAPFPAEGEHLFQLDLRDNAVEARIWNVGMPVPVEPDLRYEDGTYRSGYAGFGCHSPDPDGGFAAFFEFVCVSDGEANESLFVRGDCNGDNEETGVSDAVFLLNYNYRGTTAPPCEAACDANGDGDIGGVTDAIYLLAFLFLGGPAPLAPFPECGPESLPDTPLSCEEPLARCQAP
jgi:hypothetical protein